MPQQTAAQPQDSQVQNPQANNEASSPPSASHSQTDSPAARHKPRKSKRVQARNSDGSPELSADEKWEVLTQEIEKAEKLAESELELTHWFIQHGKHDIARRRLEHLLAVYPASSSAPAARELLEQLEHAAT